MKFYDIILPLPTSVNASHTVSRGFFNKQTGKYQRVMARSADYNEWSQYAGIEWRRQFPRGIAQKFTGRLKVEYIFVWIEGKAGTLTSDIGNREKVLSDFLQNKFFENDKQIDEQHQFRRIVKEGDPHVRVRITEIPDFRFSQESLVYSFKYKGTN